MTKAIQHSRSLTNPRQEFTYISYTGSDTDSVADDRMSCYHTHRRHRRTVTESVCCQFPGRATEQCTWDRLLPPNIICGLIAGETSNVLSANRYRFTEVFSPWLAFAFRQSLENPTLVAKISRGHSPLRHNSSWRLAFSSIGHIVKDRKWITTVGI